MTLLDDPNDRVASQTGFAPEAARGARQYAATAQSHLIAYPATFKCLSSPIQNMSGSHRSLLRGKSASAAYVSAGYAKSDSNASRLSGNEKVRARVDELLQIGAEQAGVTVQRIVEEYAKVGVRQHGGLHARRGRG